jgi:hypothetical protein
VGAPSEFRRDGTGSKARENDPVKELPKVVVQRLQTATNADHPDPDVITAFVEKSLGERERDQVLGHLALCRDCREVVTLSFPEQEAPLSAAASVRPVWLAWPVLRWGALVACIVVVGAAVTLQRQFRGGLPAAERADTSKVAQETPQTAFDATAVPAAKANLPPPSEAKPDVHAAARKVESAKESLQGFVIAAKTENSPASAPGLRDQGLSIPAQTGAVEVESAAGAVNPSSNAMDEAVPGRAKDTLQPSLPGAAMAGGGPMAAKPAVALAQSGLAKKALAAPLGVPPRWTLSADGTLQRSLDSGRTWETISVAGQAGFLALAADGLEIWVGGVKAALYHSSDAGQHWRQVQLTANGELLSDDILGVEFTDRLHGTVTTSRQEKWHTADAGQTWQKQ